MKKRIINWLWRVVFNEKKLELFVYAEQNKKKIIDRWIWENLTGKGPDNWYVFCRDRIEKYDQIISRRDEIFAEMNPLLTRHFENPKQLTEEEHNRMCSLLNDWKDTMNQLEFYENSQR